MAPLRADLEAAQKILKDDAEEQRASLLEEKEREKEEVRREMRAEMEAAMADKDKDKEVQGLDGRGSHCRGQRCYFAGYVW